MIDKHILETITIKKSFTKRIMTKVIYNFSIFYLFLLVCCEIALISRFVDKFACFDFSSICFITSTNLAFHLFLLCWLNYKSDFIVRSVETDLELWSLVVSVISVGGYTFFGFLRPDLSPLGYRTRCFLIVLCSLKVRRINLEVATKRLVQQ